MFIIGFLIAIITTVGIFFAARFLLRKANNNIWHSKNIDLFVRISPMIFLGSATLWGLGSWAGLNVVKLGGASIIGIFILLHLILMLTLPFSIVVKKIGLFIHHKQKTNPTNIINENRRKIIKLAAASAPALALGGMSTGVAESFAKVRFPQIEMTYENLPDALDGFKILQLTDLHLGYYFGLNHLEKTLQNAEKFDVHLVVVTGDIADDLSLMTDAMKLVGQYKTPFGAFVSLGNHEYFRGIERAIRNIEAGPVPLLRSENYIMDIYGTRILVGGADDPQRLYSMESLNFLKNSLSKTFKQAPSADFRLLMSHRPQALDLAQYFDIDLVLSGHTHGGQVGLNGKSIWELFTENRYLWGVYTKGTSKLYTSSGMGHWFPFRLGCPLEAPVITLRKETGNV